MAGAVVSCLPGHFASLSSAPCERLRTPAPTGMLGERLIDHIAGRSRLPACANGLLIRAILAARTPVSGSRSAGMVFARRDVGLAARPECLLNSKVDVAHVQKVCIDLTEAYG
jgi:hypothetical protein